MRRYFIIGLIIAGVLALLVLALGAGQDQGQGELTLEAVYQG